MAVSGYLNLFFHFEVSKISSEAYPDLCISFSAEQFDNAHYLAKISSLSMLTPPSSGWRASLVHISCFELKYTEKVETDSAFC